MKKIRMFAYNFINPITIILYGTGLYYLYRYSTQLVYHEFYELLDILFILLGIGFTLLIWFLTSLVLAFQGYKVEAKICNLKYFRIIGMVILIVGGIIFSTKLTDYHNTHKDTFKQCEYTIDLQLDEVYSKKEWLDIVNKQIQNIIPSDEKIYIDKSSFIQCHSSGSIESYDLKLYYNKYKDSYVHHFTYSYSKLHVKLYREAYGMIIENNARYNDFIKSIEKITEPKNKYELSLVSTPNEIEHTKYYKIDNNNYLQLRIINDTDFNK